MTQAAHTPVSGRRATAFTSVLVFAMGMATFGIIAVSVLASALIDEFGISRADIGTVLAFNTLTGAFLSPVAGRFVDRLGSARSVVALYAFAGAGFVLTGLAPNYAVLLVAGLVLGLAQALGNPSTNKAIASFVDPRRRGLVTGLKQSGVQGLIFVGGVTIPLLSSALGWRWTLVLVGALSALIVPVTLAVFPGERDDATHPVESGPAPVPTAMWWITVYGFLLGFAGAVTTFIPLFVEEDLGRSVFLGGAAVAVSGLAAMIARVWWARYANATGWYLESLAVIAIGSIVGSLMLVFAIDGGLAWLWLAVILIGLMTNSWNAVGMIAVIDLSPPDLAGRASGRVMLGFLLGLATGPRVYGEMIDRTESYAPVWWLSVALSVVALALTILWRWRASRTGGPDAQGDAG